MTDLAKLEDIPGTAHAWRQALADWRAGFPTPLAELMRLHPTPAWVAKPLADFIEGKGPMPATHGKAKAKYSPTAKQRAARDWLAALESLEDARESADERKALNGLRDLRKDWLEQLAAHYGLSIATIEKAAKDRKAARKP